VQTVNRQYPLPHKDNVVLEDLERLRATFGMIDADVVELENKVDETSDTVSDLENRAVHAPYVVENSEIQNIAPNRYLKTADEGTGFECVDGGGDEGGRTGQNSIKKSDENYDTTWGDLLEVSKKGMTVQQNADFSQSNETHIFASETDETGEASRFPHADLVNRQITENVFAENNESFILADGVEQIVEEIPIATNLNYGFVKVGDNIKNINGKISVEKQGVTSKINFGLMKIGDGIGENDGEISAQPTEAATMSTFGVVKLGEDFSLNANGEIEVAEIGDEEMVIYDLAKMKIVYNGIVDLEENIAIYRAFLNEDLQFSFNVGFVPESDFSFWLEIISDGEHVIDFAEEIAGGITCVNRGITRIKFTKLLGSSKWDAEVNILEAPEARLLTLDRGDTVQSDVIYSCNGMSWDCHSAIGYDLGNVSFYHNPREYFFDFAKSVWVEYVKFCDPTGASKSIFEFYGSNDKIHWTRLIYKLSQPINDRVYTERKGCFHYFKLVFSQEGECRGIQLYGVTVENNNSELILLTPSMTAATVAGITISCSELIYGDLLNVTTPTQDNYAGIRRGSFPDAFIQYEFAIPQVANFLDMSSHHTNLQMTARWFKLMASNDGVDWDLLLERQYQEDWKQKETRYFEFENTTAYQYYRLVCSYTNEVEQRWWLSRFRLFRRESGTSYFKNCLPPLIAPFQDGYEVSASSEHDSAHAAVNAFDGSEDTKWATAAGAQNNSWLKIKLPEEAVFNAAYIQARGENSHPQAPSAFKIQGSEDGTTWTDLTYESASWSEKEVKIFYWFNETPYLYYRLLIESTQSIHAGLAQFQLGTRAKTYRRYLNKYDCLVPAMTSNSMDGFIASASSEYNNDWGAWRAFDRGSGQWAGAAGVNSNVELKIQLPTAKSCGFFRLTGADATGRSPSKFKIEGSNNSSTWTTLYEQATAAGFGGSESRMYANPFPDMPFLYYRLFVTENAGDGFLAVQEFALIEENYVTEY
jgi:hypothetical protein